MAFAMSDAMRVALTLTVVLGVAAPAGAAGVSEPDATAYRSLLLGAGRTRGAAVSEARAEDGTVFTRFEAGDLEAALQKIRAHIEQFVQARDADREAVARDFEGLVLQRRGQVDQALGSHRAAVALLERATSPPRLLSRINAIINLATALYFTADYEQAADQLDAALKIAEPFRSLAPVHLARGRALNNLGLVHQELGRFDRARASFLEVIGVAATPPASDDERQLRAQALNNHARLLAAEGNLVEARASLEHARTLAVATAGSGLQANVLDSLAEVLLDTSGSEPVRRALLEAALAHLDAALKLEGQEPNAMIRAGILIRRGRVLAGLARRTEASRALDEALNLAANVNAPGVIRAAYEARGELRLGGTTDADRKGGVADLKEAVEIVERRPGRDVAGAERDFVRAVGRLYTRLVDALLRQGDVAAALDYLERSKAAALRRELLKRSPALRDADTERALQGAQGVLRQEEALAEQIAELRRAGKEQAADRLQSELAAVHRQAQVAVAELHQKYPDFRQYVSVSPETLQGLEPLLPERHLLVTYFAADDALWVFFVTNPGGLQWRRVPHAGRRDLEARIRRYRELATHVRGDRDRWRVDSWAAPQWAELREVGDWLYRALLAPIEREWRSATHLLVAPTGLLFYLPFQAIGPYDPATGRLRFVVEDVAVSYVTNASLLPVALAQRKTRARTMVALGNPVYRHERPALKPLDFAEREVAAIQTIFGPRGLALAGEQATLGNLRGSLSGERRGIVHLATHGVVDAGSPADSWLAFEGRTRLRARDVPGLDLRATHLVTLSACETGLEGDKPGTELMSLGRFFTTAGVPSVIVSLWKVDDVATQELMVTFYRRLDAETGSVDKAEAMRDAQRALLANPALRHPFYWAGFVLIGDWR